MHPKELQMKNYTQLTMNERETIAKMRQSALHPVDWTELSPK